MDAQTVATWALIGLAGVYLVRRYVRAWRAAKSGCGGSCGCAKAAPAKAPALIAPEQLTLRRRNQT